MTHTFTIKGQLPGLNELIAANRRHPHSGATLKKATDAQVGWYVKTSGLPHIQVPVKVSVLWVEPSRRRDPDNVASALKYILDALQKCGVLEGDGHRHIRGIEHRFDFDSSNPRVHVTLIEEDS